MSVTVVKGNVWTDWYPVDYGSGGTAAVRVGSIVQLNAAGAFQGVAAMGASAAAPNTAKFPFGVVVGLNDQVPTYDTTNLVNYATSVGTQATEVARKWTGAEGMTSKGEPALMAQVAILDRTVIMKANIYSSTIGTVPTLLTMTTGSAAGLTGFVHNATTGTPIAYQSTYYCRTGLNKGLYRVSYATSTTNPTFYLAWPYATAVGDTFVQVQTALGRNAIQLDATSCWMDNAASTNYYNVEVLSLDLQVAGRENVTFRFNTL